MKLYLEEVTFSNGSIIRNQIGSFTNGPVPIGNNPWASESSITLPSSSAPTHMTFATHLYGGGKGWAIGRSVHRVCQYNDQGLPCGLLDGEEELRISPGTVYLFLLGKTFLLVYLGERWLDKGEHPTIVTNLVNRT